MIWIREWSEMIFTFGNKSACKGLLAAVAFLGTCTTHAATVYDESVLGDSHAGQLFVLSDEHTVFKGSQAWGADPVDGFRFVVQNGYRATIRFDHSFHGLTPGEAQAWVWDLSKLPDGAGACSPDDFAWACVGTSAPGSELVSSQIFRSEVGFATPPSWEFVDLEALTLSAGTYVLSDNYGFVRPGTDGAITGIFSRSVDIQLTAVPVPAAIWLFGSGLIGLAGLVRRRECT
jgi:hypothetical protein